MRIFLLMLPWLELFTLIQLGIYTSALTAMLYVLVTLILGIVILQRQGRVAADDSWHDQRCCRPDRGDRPTQAQGRIRTLGVAGRCGQNRPGAPQPRDYRGRLSPPG